MATKVPMATNFPKATKVPMATKVPKCNPRGFGFICNMSLFVHNKHQTRKSTNNELSNFGLIEEIMDPSRSLLTVGRGKWVNFSKLYNSIFYDHHP